MSTASPHPTKKTALGVLILGALGVVFGDIGTSPLYAINEIFFGHGKLPITTENILGAIGLVIWMLTIVVTLKYVAFVLLADKEGQGGVFALLGLLAEHKKKAVVSGLLIILVLAAGLLFGEGIITPAISILSAVEGLSIATSVFNPYILPITLVILTFVFSIQYKGTSKVGAVFGPIMVIWFGSLALLGINQIWHQPAIIAALNPYHALNLLRSLSFINIMFLFGAVVLAVTGVEALYADMGHFGLRPLRISWLSFVYPALILNYLGQGAYLLSGSPVLNNNIFYSLVPGKLLYPMVILATMATIIASQALISGAYSLTAQAVALNYLPRFRVIHTNKKEEGQIYVPVVNWLLYIGSMSLVIEFKSSVALAAAYGLAVSGVMFTTSLAMVCISIYYWGWPWWRSALLFGLFGLIDLTFFVSNSIKFLEGGYVPLAIGFGLFAVMSTWNWGRRMMYDSLDHYAGSKKMASLAVLKQKLAEGSGIVVDDRGQFVEAERVVLFLVYRPVIDPEDNIPVMVRAYMRQSGTIPKYTILLNIHQTKVPFQRRNRYIVKDFGNNLYGVEARFGFMENMVLADIVKDISEDIPVLKLNRYMIEAGGEQIRAGDRLSAFNHFRLRFFRMLQKLATPTYRYFGVDQTMTINTTGLNVSINNYEGEVRLPLLDLADRSSIVS